MKSLITSIFLIQTANAQEPIAIGLAERVDAFYGWAIGIGAVVALAIMIYGGVLYSASAGNPSGIEEAKKWIQHALFGLGLLLASFLILNTINPELTRLEQIFLDPNPRSDVRSPEPGFFTGAPSYQGPDCNGFYDSDFLAPVGNFGDPGCDYANAVRSQQGRAAFVERVRNAVILELEDQTDYCQANIDYVTTVMVDQVAHCETGGTYNPNSYNPNSTSGHGAFGLFQMNPSEVNAPYDKGDVRWQEQVENAIGRYYNYSAAYWACWNRLDIPKLTSC